MSESVLAMPDGSYAVADAHQPGVGLRVVEMFPAVYGCSCGATNFRDRPACAHIRAAMAARVSEHAESQIGASR